MKKIVGILVCLLFILQLGVAVSTESNSDYFSFGYIFYTEHDPIYIDGDENFNEENGVTTGNGTIDYPYLIEGLEIKCDVENGIVIRNTSVYFIIKNCFIYNGGMKNDGIVFYNVTNGTIDYNIITRNRNGVIFRAQYPGKENSDYNIISNNSINSNSDDGINFEHTGWGWHSMNSIFSNDIFSNTRGIYMVMSSENNILYNNIFSNSGYGIQLDMCMGGGEQNIIYHNNFFNNEGDEGQVCEWGDPLNYWDDSYPSGGNFWSDYDGKDSYHGPYQDILGSDGIGDLPYDIPEGKNQDKYPLMELWNISNAPPNKPSKPVGQINGTIRQKYSYITNTTDPDGGQVYYNWSWGDNTYSGWIGLYDSGEKIIESHIWSIKGNYEIKVKARDIYGYESVWSDSLLLTMPKNKATSTPLFLQNFFQRFPFFEKILNQYYN